MLPGLREKATRGSGDQNRIRSLKQFCLLLGRKVCLVKAMVFPVLMYGCESWSVKKAEH